MRRNLDMVVVPDVIDAVKDYDDIHVLAAGGIATGRQMAATAMGAAGAVRLDYGDHRGGRDDADGKEKMLAAGPRNTVRSRSRTGKPTRQLQSAWTDAWYRRRPRPADALAGVLSRPPWIKSTAWRRAVTPARRPWRPITLAGRRPDEPGEVGARWSMNS